MTRPIRILDEHTANRIAAGEVVERPASVVKELVENALDAQATAVTVDIQGGGIERIRVTDNGGGIPAQDVRLAFERHATSKIASGDTLTDIETLGFRGEALPSIASVAKVTLTTRHREEETGVRIEVAGGAVMDLKQAGCPQGTTVVVSDLFYNTPARRKFLKRPAAEAAMIGELMSSLALSRPEISIRFSQNGATSFQTPGDGKLLSALYTVLGSSVAKDMLPVAGESGYVKVTGYVAGGALARGNRQNEIFFVNGRTVRSAVLMQGIETAMRERVMVGRFPVCVLSVAVPPAAVDVNCHPAKTQVRFSDENYVRQAVYDIVFGALTRQHILKNAAADFIPESPAPPKVAPFVLADEKSEVQRTVEQLHLGVRPPQPPMVLRDSGVLENTGNVRGAFGVHSIESAREKTEFAGQGAPVPVREEAENPAVAEYEILGQVFGAFVFIKTEGKLFVIDQHAAHERLLYDRFMREFSGGNASQKLLVARVFDVTIGDKAVIMENLEALAEAGFEIDEFGANTIRISSVPVILGEPDISGFFSEFVDRLSEVAAQRETGKKRDRIITMACKKAVKAGDPLDEREIRALLHMLLASGSPPTCPHGRPVLIEITKRELERRFGRIV